MARAGSKKQDVGPADMPRLLAEQLELLRDMRELMEEQVEDLRRNREELANPERLKEKQMSILRATTEAYREMGLTDVSPEQETAAQPGRAGGQS